MSEISDGSVRFDIIIAVLRFVSSNDNNFSLINVNDNEFTIIKDEIPESYVLPKVVGRRMVARFVGKYGIQNHYFYHPESILPTNGTKH